MPYQERYSDEDDSFIDDDEQIEGSYVASRIIKQLYGRNKHDFQNDDYESSDMEAG